MACLSLKGRQNDEAETEEVESKAALENNGYLSYANKLTNAIRRVNITDTPKACGGMLCAKKHEEFAGGVVDL